LGWLRNRAEGNGTGSRWPAVAATAVDGPTGHWMSPAQVGGRGRQLRGTYLTVVQARLDPSSHHHPSTLQNAMARCCRFHMQRRQLALRGVPFPFCVWFSGYFPSSQPQQGTWVFTCWGTGTETSEPAGDGDILRRRWVVIDTLPGRHSSDYLIYRAQCLLALVVCDIAL